MTDSTQRNKISLSNMKPLLDSLNSEGASVLINFNFVDQKDPSVTDISIDFSPVEQNPEINSIAYEFSMTLKEILPHVMNCVYDSLVSKGKLDKSEVWNCNSKDSGDGEQDEQESAVH